MSSQSDVGVAVSILERWFKGHCNGWWEHHLGITIQTTDDSGWVLTFRELKLTKEVLADTIGDLLRQYDAQVGTDGTMVRVVGSSLQQVLLAGAILAERSGGISNKSGSKAL